MAFSIRGCARFIGLSRLGAGAVQVPRVAVRFIRLVLSNQMYSGCAWKGGCVLCEKLKTVAQVYWEDVAVLQLTLTACVSKCNPRASLHLSKSAYVNDQNIIILLFPHPLSFQVLGGVSASATSTRIAVPSMAPMVRDDTTWLRSCCHLFFSPPLFFLELTSAYLVFKQLKTSLSNL